MNRAMTGEAERQGRIWGARAAAWAEEEAAEAPKFEAVIARVGLASGRAVLDVGCGSGVFLALAAGRGARDLRARRLGGADRGRPRPACPTPT